MTPTGAALDQLSPPGDPRRSTAADEDDALHRLQQAYDLVPDEAQAVLDLQFRNVAQARRTAISDELAVLRSVLDEPGGPPSR